MKTIICLSLIAAWALQSAPANNAELTYNAEQNRVATSLNPAMPDLIVRGNEFEFAGNKVVNVYVSNNGDAPSKRCILELTIRKIGGVSAGRKTTAKIPVIQPGQFVKIPVDATSILPIAVNLKDTTFKVVADSTNINAESNETNNEKWHNLN